MVLLAGCGERAAAPADVAKPAAAAPAPPAASAPSARTPSVTVSEGSAADAGLNWDVPPVQVTAAGARAARRDAASAVRTGDLFEQSRDAIPLYLALLQLDPKDRIAKAGLARAGTALLAQGNRAVAAADEDSTALARAVRIAAVLRTILADDRRTEAYLVRLDLAEQLARLNATSCGRACWAKPAPLARGAPSSQRWRWRRGSRALSRAWLRPRAPSSVAPKSPRARATSAPPRAGWALPTACVRRHRRSRMPMPGSKPSAPARLRRCVMPAWPIWSRRWG
jgi:hypothetical protein